MKDAIADKLLGLLDKAGVDVPKDDDKENGQNQETIPIKTTLNMNMMEKFEKLQKKEVKSQEKEFVGGKEANVVADADEAATSKNVEKVTSATAAVVEEFSFSNTVPADEVEPALKVAEVKPIVKVKASRAALF